MSLQTISVAEEQLRLRIKGSDVPFLGLLRDFLSPAIRTTIELLRFPKKSGNHYMAAEYLRQVGVPVAFADDLAERMLAFARRVGVPDQDDPEAIKSWQQALHALLNPPFSVTAQKGVTLDTERIRTEHAAKQPTARRGCPRRAEA